MREPAVATTVAAHLTESANRSAGTSRFDSSDNPQENNFRPAD